jgi:hypothetical protein
MGNSKSVREREELRGQAIASKVGAAPGSLQRRTDGWYEGNVKVADTAGNLTPEGQQFATAVAPKGGEAKSPLITIGENYQENVDADQAERTTDEDKVTDFLMQWSELEYDPQFRDEMIAASEEEKRLREELRAFDPRQFAQIESDRAMREQLSAAGATRGGLGAQLAARDRAQAMAPQLQQTALEAGLNRYTENQGLISQSLGRTADIAASGWSQDDQRVNKQAEVGLAIGKQIGDMMGLDWQLDSKESSALASLAADLVRIEQSGEAIDNAMVLGMLQEKVKMYGLDLNESANMKALYANLEAQKIGWDDIAMAGLTTGGQVLASYAGRK